VRRVDKGGDEEAREEERERVAERLGEEVAARAVGRRVGRHEEADQPDRRPGVEQDPQVGEQPGREREDARRLERARGVVEPEGGVGEVPDAGARRVAGEQHAGRHSDREGDAGRGACPRHLVRAFLQGAHD